MARSRRRGTSETDGERAVAAVVRGLVDAWNRGDAEAFSRAFAPSATYVTGAGEEVQGRTAIAELVKQGEAGVAIVGGVRVRCSGGAGTVRFGWTSSGRQGVARSGTIACALARTGRTWFIQRLTNEERRARRPPSTRPEGRTRP